MISKNIIESTVSVMKALDLLNSIANKSYQTLFVVENNKLLGTLTDGDIRRGLIKGLTTKDDLSSFINKTFLYLNENESYNNRVKDFNKNNVILLPVLDSAGLLIDIIDLSEYKEKLPVCAVIMAGGKGKRLRPLTENKPKPLLEIGNRPILDTNLIHLANSGISDVIISVNYLGDQIIEHVDNGSQFNLNVTYLKEEKFLGTAGALGAINNYSEDSVIIMNSDLLTNIDYVDFYDSFIRSDADIQIATVPYQVNIPYAVLENDENGKVLSLKEKPVYTYYSNAGIYLVKSKLLMEIKEGVKYDATDLIEDSLKSGKKVSSYPIRSYWLDIGKMEDYQKAQEDIKHIKF